MLKTNLDELVSAEVFSNVFRRGILTFSRFSSLLWVSRRVKSSLFYRTWSQLSACQVFETCPEEVNCTRRYMASLMGKTWWMTAGDMPRMKLTDPQLLKQRHMDWDCGPIWAPFATISAIIGFAWNFTNSYMWMNSKYLVWHDDLSTWMHKVTAAYKYRAAYT